MADTIQTQSGEDHRILQKGFDTVFEALLKMAYLNVDAYEQSHYQEVAHIFKKMLVASNDVLLTKDKVVALKKNNVEEILCIVFDQDGEFDTDWLYIDYLDEQNGVMVDGNRDIVYCSSTEECQAMLKTLNTLPQQYRKELEKKATIEVEENLKMNGVSTTSEKRKRVVQKTEQRNKIGKLEDKISGLYAEIRACQHKIQEIRDAQKS